MYPNFWMVVVVYYSCFSHAIEQVKLCWIKQTRHKGNKFFLFCFFNIYWPCLFKIRIKCFLIGHVLICSLVKLSFRLLVFNCLQTFMVNWIQFKTSGFFSTTMTLSIPEADSNVMAQDGWCGGDRWATWSAFSQCLCNLHFWCDYKECLIKCRILSLFLSFSVYLLFSFPFVVFRTPILSFLSFLSFLDHNVNSLPKNKTSVNIYTFSCK